MFLTMRAVWAMLAGIALVLIAPRPTTVLAWAGVVTVLVVIDVVSAPSPAVLRASRSPTPVGARPASCCAMPGPPAPGRPTIAGR